MDAIQRNIQRERVLSEILLRFEENYSSLIREFSSKEGSDRNEDEFLQDRQSLRDALVDGISALSQDKEGDYDYQQLFLDAIENVYKIQVAAAKAAIILQAKIKKLNESRLLGPEDGDEWDHRRFIKRVSGVTDVWLLNEIIEIVGCTESKERILNTYFGVKDST